MNGEMPTSPNSGEEYIQLTSWDELIAWLEREGYKAIPIEPPWNPAPKRKKKAPPAIGGAVLIGARLTVRPSTPITCRDVISSYRVLDMGGHLTDRRSRPLSISRHA